MGWSTSGVAKFGIKVRRAATQAITTGVTTRILFEAGDVVWGDDSWVDEDGYVVIPESMRGRSALIVAQVQWAANSTGYREMSCGTDAVLAGHAVCRANTAGTTLQAWGFRRLDGAEKLRLHAFQSSGGDLNTQATGTFLQVQVLD